MFDRKNQFALGAVIAALTLFPAAAFAHDASDVAGDMSSAVATVQAPAPAVAQAGVQVAATASEPTIVQTAAGKPVTLEVPATGAGETVAGTTVFAGTGSHNQLGVQALDGGARALIRIEGPDAPERYEFRVGGAAEHLDIREDGSVDVLDAEGDSIAIIAAPWAVDAAGTPIPTRYKTSGRTLIQQVEHRDGHYIYPIVADPSLWAIAKCVAAITWVIGTTVFAIGKLTKIKAGIKALGGITSTAKLLLGATSRAEKLRAIGGTMATAAADFLGIATIRDNC